MQWCSQGHAWVPHRRARSSLKVHSAGVAQLCGAGRGGRSLCVSFSHTFHGSTWHVEKWSKERGIWLADCPTPFSTSALVAKVYSLLERSLPGCTRRRTGWRPWPDCRLRRVRQAQLLLQAAHKAAKWSSGLHHNYSCCCSAAAIMLPSFPITHQRATLMLSPLMMLSCTWVEFGRSRWHVSSCQAAPKLLHV